MTTFLTAVIAPLMNAVATRWRQFHATEDAGEIDEKTLIVAIMSGATITIIAIIIAAITLRANEGAGYLGQ